MPFLQLYCTFPKTAPLVLKPVIDWNNLVLLLCWIVNGLKIFLGLSLREWDSCCCYSWIIYSTHFLFRLSFFLFFFFVIVNCFGISWFFFNRMSCKELGTNTGHFQSTATPVPHHRLLAAPPLCAPAGQRAACGFAVCHPGKPTSLSSGKYLNSIISRQT